MKKIAFILSVILVSMLFSNCSGNSTEKSEANNVLNKNEIQNQNIPGISNVNVSNVDVNTMNSNTAENGEPIKPKTSRTLVNTPVDENAKLKSDATNPNFRPAPDDSVYGSSMNEKQQFIEVRAFRSHPVLSKVEKVFVTAEKIQYKIYLRNGKVINGPADKLANFAIMPADQILQAVGLQPPSPQNTPQPQVNIKQNPDLMKKQ